MAPGTATTIANMQMVYLKRLKTAMGKRQGKCNYARQQAFAVELPRSLT